MNDTKPMADGVLATAVNVIAAPGEAFRAIRHKPTMLAPLCAIIVANAAVLLTYYGEVDVLWLFETGMQASPEELSEEQREAAARAMGNLSPMVLGSVAAVSVALFMTLWIFLNAAYLAGISLLSNDGLRLRAWMAMICWCSLPLIFGSAASLVNIFLSDATFMRADRLNPLSFSSLLDLDSAGSGSMRQSLLGTDVTAVWAMALGVYGYRTWTGRHLPVSALIVLGPAILVFGGIAWFTSG